MTTKPYQQWSVLVASTLAFTVCFAIWMMFAVIGIPIKKMLDLNETQFGLLAATPVLAGSLTRLPLGMLTDKFGGRIVFFVLTVRSSSRKRACSRRSHPHARYSPTAILSARPSLALKLKPWFGAA